MNDPNINIDDDEANGIIDYKVTFDASGFKVVVNCSKTEKEKPVKPNLPEESPKDIIAVIPGVIYIDVTSADAKKEAVEDVVAAVGGVLKAEDLVVNEETALIEAAESTLVKAAEKALADKGERATVAKVRPLPVFAVESGDITEAGAVVAVGFEMKGLEFLAAKPEEVRLLKVRVRLPESSLNTPQTRKPSETDPLRCRTRTTPCSPELSTRRRNTSWCSL
ncbi:MAG: hypothetical protein ACLUEQ_04190 [Cloacibacillus evryensis]